MITIKLKDQLINWNNVFDCYVNKDYIVFRSNSDQVVNIQVKDKYESEIIMNTIHSALLNGVCNFIDCDK